MKRQGHKGDYGRYAWPMLDRDKVKRGRYKNCVPCRCYTCNRRAVLSMLPWRYLREHHAICCGKLLRIDWYRYSGAEGRAQRCTCDHYHHPHRRGSPFCRHGGLFGAHGWPSFQSRTAEFGEWLLEIGGIDALRPKARK